MKDDAILPVPGTASPAAQSGKTRPVRVLVADDDADLRQAVSEMLGRVGYVVDAAEDGEHAWDTLQRNSYDLLITDNNMPKVSGVELLAKVRTAKIPLPVIMITSAVPEHEFKKRPWLTPEATVLKPFDFPELMEKIKTILCLKARETTGSSSTQPNLPLFDGLQM